MKSISIVCSAIYYVDKCIYNIYSYVHEYIVLSFMRGMCLPTPWMHLHIHDYDYDRKVLSLVFNNKYVVNLIKKYSRIHNNTYLPCLNFDIQ